MYTNINAKHGYQVFERLLHQANADRPQNNIPTSFFLALLQVVMERNIFQFDDTFWLQQLGTAMGTAAACMYATLYYAEHERDTILDIFRLCLLLYRRFIDDIFGIWIGTDAEWDRFRNSLNFGDLRWETSPLSTKVTFLDLTIEIDPTTRQLVTKTYQKPLNLFLYLPPHSAHPPGVLKSLVYGMLGRFQRQNSNRNDYVRLVRQFAQQLMARGHDIIQLRPLFLQAANHLDLKTRHPSTKTDTDALFLAWPYHPRGIPRQELRAIYDRTLAGHSGFDRLIIAYRRPKNLRDALMRTQLNEPAGSRVSELHPPAETSPNAFETRHSVTFCHTPAPNGASV